MNLPGASASLLQLHVRPSAAPSLVIDILPLLSVTAYYWYSQWAWLVHDWHPKWHIIVAVLDAPARRRITPCCDQLLISLQYMQAFHTSALHEMLLIASATSLGRLYTMGGRLMWGSWIFDVFWQPRRRVDFYADRLVRAYKWYTIFLRCRNWENQWWATN